MAQRPSAQSAPLSEADFVKITKIAEAEAGLYLPPTKRSMVTARLRRRMKALQLANIADYLDLIAPDDAPERDRLISALTTNVSQFFREPHHFETLCRQILPKLKAKAASGGRIRLWSAGCANGQEPYSLAMSILSHWPEAAQIDLRILASDIDATALDFAQRGQFSQEMMQGLTQEQRETWFTPGTTSGQFQISANLQALISFRRLNLHGSWPMQGAFDVIFCRNVVIYFDQTRQSRLWDRLSKALTSQGWLFVGHSERVAQTCGLVLSPSCHSTYFRSGP